MIITDRLLLQRPLQADFDRYYQINADPDTNLFNPKGPMELKTAEKNFAALLVYWENFGFGTWSIREKGNPGYTIGFGGLSDRYYGTEIKLNLGYRFDKNYWGKGYATELTKATIAFGLHELGKKEIFAIVRPQHLVSVKVLEKSGMILVDELDDVPGEAQSLIYKIEKA